MLFLGILLINDAPFWKSDSGMAVVDLFLDTMRKIGGKDDACVVVDSLEMKEHVEGHGIRTHYVTRTSSHRNDDSMERQLSRALRACLEGADAAHDAIAALNVRNPLAWSRLDRFVTSRETFPHDMVSISVASVRDHPCQYNHYGSILDMGVACFFDDAYGSSSPEQRAATFPFPFDWARWGVTQADTGHFCFEGAFPPHDGRDAGVLWRFESPSRARLSLPRERVAPDMLGAAFGVWSQPGLFRLSGPANEPLAQLRWPTAAEGGRIVCASSFNERGTLRSVYAPVQATGREASAVLPVGEGIHGFRYAVVGIAEDAIFETALPVVIDGLRYHAAMIENECVRFNDLNGERIYGRQNFPALFEIDASFAVIPKQRLRAFVAGEEAEFFPVYLDENEIISIEDEVDYIMYEAIQRKGN